MKNRLPEECPHGAPFDEDGDADCEQCDRDFEDAMRDSLDDNEMEDI